VITWRAWFSLISYFNAGNKSPTTSLGADLLVNRSLILPLACTRVTNDRCIRISDCSIRVSLTSLLLISAVSKFSLLYTVDKVDQLFLQFISLWWNVLYFFPLLQKIINTLSHKYAVPISHIKVILCTHV